MFNLWLVPLDLTHVLSFLRQDVVDLVAEDESFIPVVGGVADVAVIDEGVHEVGGVDAADVLFEPRNGLGTGETVVWQVDPGQLAAYEVEAFDGVQHGLDDLTQLRRLVVFDEVLVLGGFHLLAVSLGV